MALKNGQLGKFAPCQDGCGYLDIVSSLADQRRRHWGDSWIEQWNGTDANPDISGTRNNMGQHLAASLDCEVGVHNYLRQPGSNSDRLRLYKRDRNTGVDDPDPVWDVLAGPELETWIDEMGGWIAFRLIAFQSSGSRFCIYGVNFLIPNLPDIIQIRDINTGLVISAGTAPSTLDSETDHDPYDLVPIDDKNIVAVTSDAAPFYDTHAYELDEDVPAVPTNPWPFPNQWRDITPTNCEAEPQASLYGDNAGMFGSFIRAPSLGQGSMRPSIGRYNGAWGWGQAATDGDRPPTIESPIQTLFKEGAGPCDWGLLGPNQKDLYGETALSSSYGGLFTSPYCSRIYHVPTGQQSNEVLRYHPDTETIDLLPLGFLDGQGLPFRLGDWMHVVEDGHRLPDGTFTEDDCDVANRCGNTAGGPDEPDCCYQDEEQQIPWLEVSFSSGFLRCDNPTVNVPPDPGCIDKHPERTCILFEVFAFLDGGCPGDRIISLLVEGFAYPVGSVPTLVPPCFGIVYLSTDDDFWHIQAGWDFIPQDFCRYWRITAETLAGCKHRSFHFGGEIQPDVRCFG